MRKLSVLLPVLLLIIVFDVAAEKNYTSEKIVFLPQDFYVGDLVEMRVVIVPEPGVIVAKPEKLPESYWVKIENTEVIALDKEFELRVYLRLYAPGIRTLPPLQFGDVNLRDIRIQTKSVLSEKVLPLSPPAGQLLLPGTKYYIALFTGILFLLPVFFIFFWNRFKGVIHSYFLEQRRRRPYKRLVRVLKELENRMNEMKGKDFYTVLINELRIYLTTRASTDYTSSTAREASVSIVSDFADTVGYPELIRLFRLADEVKFGNRRVLIHKREEDLIVVKKTADEIEERATGGEKDVDT